MIKLKLNNLERIFTNQHLCYNHIGDVKKSSRPCKLILDMSENVLSILKRDYDVIATYSSDKYGLRFFISLNEDCFYDLFYVDNKGLCHNILTLETDGYLDTWNIRFIVDDNDDCTLEIADELEMVI